MLRPTSSTYDGLLYYTTNCLFRVTISYTGTSRLTQFQATQLQTCTIFIYPKEIIPCLKTSVSFLVEVKVKWEESAWLILVDGNIGSGVLNLVQSYSGALFVCFWRDSPQWARASSFTRFIDHTQRSTTVGTTPQNDWSARHKDLYLTTHNTHNRQTSIHPVEYESQYLQVGGRRLTP
jgi:hypothetical protein